VVGAGHALARAALAGNTARGGKPTAYACIGPQCSLPGTEPQGLPDLLRMQRAAP
jgi:hypothetical protein